MTGSHISDSVSRRRGVSSEELRRHNLAAVLDRLHVGGPMPRSRLAELTGLNRSTIRDLIVELTGLGLVEEERGPTGEGPGRPSAVARAHPPGAVVVAVEVEVGWMAVATVGLGGHIFDKVRVAHGSEAPTPADVVERLADICGPLLAALPSGHTLAGAGIAVAGVVRRHDGFVHTAPNLGWVDVPFAELMRSTLGPGRVMMANEADLGALAEFRRGVGRHTRNLILLTGEVGVGIGIIYDGKPMLGSAGYAGEAGHMVVNPAGRTCRCGAVGCWETEIGTDALAEMVGATADDAREGLVADVIRRAGEGDAAVSAALTEIGRWLGVGIGNLVNVLNPDLVVLGGSFHELHPWLEESMNRGAEATALSAPWRTCSIRPGALGADASLVGAAELVFAEVIADPTRSMETHRASVGIPAGGATD